MFETDRTDRQGPVVNARYRVVCRACNSGWMSALEEAVRPILSRVLTGTPVTLSPEQQRLLATYFTMKLMVFDQAPKGAPVITRAERQAFFEKRTHPASLKLWILATEDPNWRTAVFSNAFELAHTKDQRPNARNAKLTLWGIGRVVVVALYVRDIEIAVPLVLDPVSSLRLLPPSLPPRIWPPLNYVTGPELDQLADALRARMEDFD
jgi:hypothetical protein